MSEQFKETEIPTNEEIDLKKIIFILFDAKYFITSFTIFAAIFSVFYALSLPNMYTSKALLAQSTQDESLSSNLGPVSSIANITGLDMYALNLKSVEGVERIKSLEFFSTQFLPEISLENLMAYKQWVPDQNISIYDDEIFNQESGEWTRKVSYPKKQVPSDQEAYKKYKNAINVIKDNKTGFIHIHATHQSPIIAKKWADIVIRKINESMREENKKISQNAIDFLNSSYQTTNIQSLREAISILLESQMKNLMLASTHEDYVFKIIDSPVVPEQKSGPSRAFICITAVLFGFIFSMILAITYYFIKLYKHRFTW